MSSLILRKAARYLFPVIILFSIYALLRGHNEPGGGFVGGLAAASAFVLYELAFDVKATKSILQVDSLSLIGWGLMISCGSGLFSMLSGQPFLTGQWMTISATPEWTIQVGLPLLFDVGVYLVVLGVTLAIILSLANHRRGRG